MGVLVYLERLVNVLLLGGIAVGIFVRFAMQECKTMQFQPQPSSKIILITGGNSGLGYESAKHLAKLGAHVVLACRNSAKCSAAQDTIKAELPLASVDAMQLDLSSFESIYEFSSLFDSTYEHLDVLVNNAGIMALPERKLTKDGIEAQMGTNHFGHFLLTKLLFHKLAENGRIINHSSGAHMFHASTFPFSNLEMEEGYEAWTAYGNSKAANLLFTYELNRRLSQEENPRNIISVAVHPGYASTNLQTHSIPMYEWANFFFAMSVEDGALPQVQAAIGTSVEASMGDYIGPRYIMLGAPTVQSTLSSTHRPDAGFALWTASESRTGELFDVKSYIESTV
mmetsp:Transcript_5791/g.9526  ORF Transcript_5791/g.9526 Transcript_5791/m.9526 type:complete len:340 (+) Transcript_5791:47-1066(+)